MKKYFIVTESGSDLISEVSSRDDVVVLPMHVAMGEKNYLDGSITIDELCAHYENTKMLQ